MKYWHNLALSGFFWMCMLVRWLTIFISCFSCSQFVIFLCLCLACLQFLFYLLEYFVY